MQLTCTLLTYVYSYFNMQPKCGLLTYVYNSFKLTCNLLTSCSRVDINDNQSLKNSMTTNISTINLHFTVSTYFLIE
jgi:hypothetical protein